MNPSTYSTEEGTVRCLRNLAQICADLKVGGTSMGDEASGDSYVVDLDA